MSSVAFAGPRSSRSENRSLNSAASRPGSEGCPDDRAPAGAAIVIASVAPMTSNVHILLDEVRGYRFRETTVASRSADAASADRPLVILQWPSKSTPSSTTITGASTSP